MDHDLYEFSALPGRPRWRWSGGQGLAACAIVFLEHWEAVPAEGSLRDPRFVGEYGSFSPDYRSWTQREYGLRIGVHRVLDALREVGIRPAIAANAMVLERMPDLVARLNAQGCEWIAHGLASTRMMHARMTLEEQRRHIRASLAGIRRATGAQPKGWVSQDWGTTPQTPALLADEGLRFTLDWTNDDQPYRLRTTPPVTSIPMSAEWDDVQCQWLRNLSPRTHSQLVIDAFGQLHRECAETSRAAVFGLAIHPWVSGMPSRIAGLRETLRAIATHTDVWWTDPGSMQADFALSVPDRSADLQPDTDERSPTDDADKPS